MIFCNLENNKIINVSFPVDIDEDDLNSGELSPLQTIQIGLDESDYIVLEDDNGIIDKTTKIYDEHNQPLYEIKDNKPSLITDTNRLPKLKEIYKNKVSQMSFNKIDAILPVWEQRDAALGCYDSTKKAKIKTCVNAFRTEAKRMYALIDKAKNEDELKAIISKQKYDGISYE